MITPAEGLAFLISAIIENLFSLIFFSIFSLKLIKVLFFPINSFNESYEEFTEAYKNAREHILSNKVIEHLETIQNA